MNFLYLEKFSEFEKDDDCGGYPKGFLLTPLKQA
jgi:hypothetical protein